MGMVRPGPSGLARHAPNLRKPNRPLVQLQLGPFITLNGLMLYHGKWVKIGLLGLSSLLTGPLWA
jgi:hypothetical protein